MRGYSSTMPLFYFNFEEVPYEQVETTQLQVERFMKLVIDKM